MALLGYHLDAESFLPAARDVDSFELTAPADTESSIIPAAPMTRFGMRWCELAYSRVSSCVSFATEASVP